MERTLTNGDAKKKLKALVQDIFVCMFCVADETGHMRSRPMTTIEIDEEGDLWFFASKESEFIHHNDVCLNYSHPDKNEYLCVTGKATLVRDEHRIRELWNPNLLAFYPDGISDSRLILIKVTPQEASYWDQKGRKMVTLFEIIDSMLSHEERREHGKLFFD